MITAYIKRNYCYDKAMFSLYEPIQVPKDAIFKTGYRDNITDILASDGKTVLFSKSLFAKSFTPNKDNMLVSDYIKNPRIVQAYTDHLFQPSHTVMLHKRCEVLVEKRSSYTMLKCLDCGAISPLAINSMILTDDVTNLNFFNCK